LIVGKWTGRHRWSATTSKTMEGSAALVLAVVGGAGAHRLCGLVEPFPVRAQVAPPVERGADRA
jgi:dolichol kinase